MISISKQYIFIFDLAKSESNLAKHGIDFVKAQEIWRDPDRTPDTEAQHAGEEPRWLSFGRIENRIWTACFTYRGNRIRLISVRAARIKEREFYETWKTEKG